MIATFIKFMVVAAISYAVGFFVGRWYASEEITSIRNEMGLKEEQDGDGFNELYK